MNPRELATGEILRRSIRGGNQPYTGPIEPELQPTEAMTSTPRRRAWRYGELRQADIVEAALRICRREGLARLTMRKLAQEIGLSSMNSYHYVSSKRDLFDLVADAVLAQVPEPPDDLDRWDDQLSFMFHTARERLLEHPGVSDHLLVRATGMPNELRLHRIVDRILLAAGFSPSTSLRIQRILTYLLFGAVSQELASLAGADRSDVLTFTDDADVFDFGLATMLAGLHVTGGQDDAPRG
jgi:AcrR family transcriptional regulator